MSSPFLNHFVIKSNLLYTVSKIMNVDIGKFFEQHNL